MAGPTVKNSAYNSKPSNSQPRLAASRIFHWWRLRPRYHGCDVATVSVMAFPSLADQPAFLPRRGLRDAAAAQPVFGFYFLCRSAGAVTSSILLIRSKQPSLDIATVCSPLVSRVLKGVHARLR